MADLSKKIPKNVPGAYYVDSECIGCGMCHEVAPDYFKIDDSEGTAFVAMQPTDDDGKAACAEGMSSCPVDAIGDDGE